MFRFFNKVRFYKNNKNPFVLMQGCAFMIAERHSVIVSKRPCRHDFLLSPLQGQHQFKSKNTGFQPKKQFLWFLPTWDC